MKRVRLDVSIVERGMVDSRSKAQRMVMAGSVRVNGQLIYKPSTLISPGSEIHIDKGPRYVSRGGDKLAAAIETFNLQIPGSVCADVGASTGGFSDCLLQHGAARVYAIDVGKGILDWKLRNHPKAIIMEGVNARYIDQLPEQVDIVTVDVSFISLKIILPVIKNWLKSPVSENIEPTEFQSEESGNVVALIKPQFEAGRDQTKRGKGVIKDPVIHRQVLTNILSFAQNEGFSIQGLIRSPLLGPKGNIEFLVHLIYARQDVLDQISLIDEVLNDGGE